MAKGNKQGGKKYKSKKKREPEEKSTILKDDEQSYALISDVLGNCRFRCKLDDGQKLLGILCGRLRKRRVWIKKNDLVLISKRDYEQDKVDIILKYNPEEYDYLRNIETELDLLLGTIKEDNLFTEETELEEIQFDDISQEDGGDNFDESDGSCDLDDL